MKDMFIMALLTTAVVSAMNGAQRSAEKPFVLLEFVDRNVSLFILDEAYLSALHTKGTTIEILADCSKRLLQIRGVGEVKYKRHLIAFSGEGVSIDGQPLRGPSTSFVLTPKGDVHEGFVRTFDRKPHK